METSRQSSQVSQSLRGDFAQLSGIGFYLIYDTHILKRPQSHQERCERLASFIMKFARDRFPLLFLHSDNSFQQHRSDLFRMFYADTNGLLLNEKFSALRQYVTVDLR